MAIRDSTGSKAGLALESAAIRLGESRGRPRSSGGLIAGIPVALDDGRLPPTLPLVVEFSPEMLAGPGGKLA